MENGRITIMEIGKTTKMENGYVTTCVMKA